MKKILFTLLFLFSTTVFAQTYMLLPIVEVYDGDTIKTNLTWRLPEPLNAVSVRIYGIDTPEMPAASYATTGKLNRAKCVKEAELALQGKALVEKLAEGHPKMKVENFEWGKYGGRIVGVTYIAGVNVAEALIAAKLAVPYFGGTKTHDWCQ